MSRPTLLLDVNVGSSVQRFLKERGFDVASVIDLNPRMKDESILRLAYRENRVLITCDKDFGDLVFNKGLPHRGIIRLEDTAPRIQIAYLNTILRKHFADLSTSMIVAQGGIIRVRKAKSS